MEDWVERLQHSSTPSLQSFQGVYYAASNIGIFRE